jgi:hypothetical protein
VFTVNNGLGNSDFIIEVGGVKIPVIVDSGASVNVIDRCMWEWLKGRRVKCVSRLSDKKIYGYGNDKPLNVAGCFNANVSVNDKCVHADFFVVEEKGQALLWKQTALDLGILQIHVPKETVNVLSSDRKSVITQKYPKCFEGIGKLNNFQLKIPIDEHVTPVVQQIRRILYHLREKLEKKLCELEQYDIIEKVDGPSKWVSPVVVIPKKNDEIRLCIDMHRANDVVIREQYCIPTVDEILQDLNQSKVYSKLDIK